MSDLPTFEEWQEYCFVVGPQDFHGDSDDDKADARDLRFWAIPHPTLADLTARLFEEARSLNDLFTRDQLAKGTWYIFGGSASPLFNYILAPDIPEEKQVRVFRSIAILYRDLYDRLCNDHRTSEDDRSDTDELDGSVFMIWDMSGPEYGMLSERKPVVDACFSTLQIILDTCVTGTCLKSALHGLSHKEHAQQEQVQDMIDRFLAQRGKEVPDWLREYAHQARDGRVQ